MSTAIIEPRWVFSPPTPPIRSQQQPRKTLAASALPWTPNARGPTTSPKPPAPLHSSPATLPSTSPSSIPAMTLDDAESAAGAARAVTAKVAQRRSMISAPSKERRVYTLEEMEKLREDAAHTPRQVIDWVIALYRSDEMQSVVKVPMHLQLLVDDPQLASSTRNIIGRGSAPAIRLRPQRELHNKVMSVLSRVTPQKFPVLRKELLELPLKACDEEELLKVVKVFFEKAVQESNYSPLYASLVGEVCQMTDDERRLEKSLREKLLASRMRSLLLITCQREFEHPMTLSNDDLVDPDTGRRLSDEVVEQKCDRLKRRLCGNIKFVGELYKQKLVGERLIENILRRLVVSDKELEDYRVEGFVTLMKTVGKRCSEKQPELITEYMSRAAQIKETHSVKRITFLLMDLEDLAKQGWEPRTNSEPTTIDVRDRDMADERIRVQDEVERRIRDRKTPLNDTPSGSPLTRGPMVSQVTPTPSQPSPSRPAPEPNALSPSSRGSSHLDDTKRADDPPPKPRHRGQTTSRGSPIDCTPLASPVTVGFGSGDPRSPPKNGHGMMPKSFSQSSLHDGSSSLHRCPSDYSRPSSLPATPKQGGHLTINARDSARSILAALVAPSGGGKDGGAAAVKDSTSKIAVLQRGDRIAVVTNMIRRCVTSTSLFVERQRMPALLLAMIDSSLDGQPLCPVVELACTVAEWARLDIEYHKYTECPRFFSLWASMVEATWVESRSRDFEVTAARRAMLEILSPATFTLMLRELSTNGDRDFIATLVRDFHASTTTVLECADVLATRGEDPLMLALMCRMRILPLRSASMGRASPVSPLFPSSTPLDGALVDTVSQCYSQASGKVGDDRELEVCRWFRRAVDRSAVEDYMTKAVSSSQPVNSIVEIMKCASAMFTAAMQAEEMGISKWREEDTNDVLSRVTARFMDPALTAAVIIEGAAHLSLRRLPPEDIKQRFTRFVSRILRDSDRTTSKVLARMSACGIGPLAATGTTSDSGSAILIYANFTATKEPSISSLLTSMWI